MFAREEAAAGRARFTRRWLAVSLAAILVSAIGVGTASSDSDTVQRTEMRWHRGSGNTHLSPVGEGARAKLTRTASGISYSIDTHSLNPGHAYTVWVVVINEPGECAEDPCSPTDIIKNPATRSQIVYGTGHVVGSGRSPAGRVDRPEGAQAGFGGHVSRGPLPQGWLLPDQGLYDPRGAAVHLVLNDHGPKLTEYMPGMIRTYRAGCTDESLPAIFPPSAKADGEPGPNTCRLWQVAVFE